MSSTRFLKCACQHCEGHIEYPADAIGTSVECPHCGAATELRLDTDLAEDEAPTRRKTWLIVGLVCLFVLFAAGVSAPFVVKNYLRKRTHGAVVTTQAQATNTASSGQLINGFRVHNVTIARPTGGSIIYAVGTVENPSDKQRFGVRVQVDVFDADGKRIGSASDYANVIEPKAEWRFRALVIQSNAATAKLSGIREEQ